MTTHTRIRRSRHRCRRRRPVHRRPARPPRATAPSWSSASTRSAAAPRPTTSTASRSTTARSSSRSAASPSRPARRSARRSTSASPAPPILYRIEGKDVDVTGGGWGFLLGKLTRQGAKLVKGIGAARNDSGLPEDEMSTADWVRKYTKNEGVHGIFRNMCASVFAVGSEDLPARVFLTYFTRKSAFKRFGFHPEGTIGLWRGLAEVDRVRTAARCGCRRTVTRDRRQTATRSPVSSVIRDGETVRVAAPIVVSDIGPAATVGAARRGERARRLPGPGQAAATARPR